MLITPLVILAAVAVTSALSGVLGMGGGILLMGVCTLLLPAAAAMVVHGTAQLAANGSRAIMHRRHIVWSVLGPYTLGSLLGVAGFAALGVVTETWIIHLALGSLPFLTQAVKRGPRLSIERRSHSILCGILVTGIQLLAGASGPILDMFYLETRLTRHEVVATKALTQSLGHAIKLLYYGSLMRLGVVTTNDDLAALSAHLSPTTPIASAIFGVLVIAVVAIAGTAIGSRVLDRMSDDKFRRLSQRVVLAIGTIYLVQGIVGCAERFF